MLDSFNDPSSIPSRYISLALGYGMGEETLARRLIESGMFQHQPERSVHMLLERVRSTYPSSTLWNARRTSFRAMAEGQDVLEDLGTDD